MNLVLKPRYEWSTLPWRQLEKRVFKLQKRIYQASARGDVKTVRKLQRLLLHSWSSKCLAVRRVTQDNQGKRTAGIDGVKSLTPQQRFELVNTLNVSSQSQPTRRIWIPKANSADLRPLSIPTIADRALQALVKQAIEPEWEARFEPNSYGFRPGRSCHDAIEAIFTKIKSQAKYLLDADIAKCFERIDHDALLRKLNTSPTLRRQIRAWLKAGVMDNEHLFPTDMGTPQGGVISPLLANIALHGMEQVVKQVNPTAGLVRYADDFVVFHKELAVVQQIQQTLSVWLGKMGLELKASKTHLSHTLEVYEGRVGFDFLGFTVRQFPVGKYRTGKGTRGKPLGFKTIIRPSKQSISTHIQRVNQVIKNHRGAPQQALTGKLTPILRGWTMYFSTVICQKVFDQLDHLICHALIRWGKYRHPHLSIRWTVRKYWRTIEGNHWRFATPQRKELLPLYRDTSVRQHIKVQGIRTPYDGDWLYWSSRMGKHPLVPKKVTTLLKRQRGKCGFCGLFFNHDDQMEIDHVTPKTLGGSNQWDNLQLLHRHCHDTKTKDDMNLIKSLG
jgi:RNA-directed DNA polymerase